MEMEQRLVLTGWLIGHQQLMVIVLLKEVHLVQPIFNNNGLVVGTLTGGSSYCTSPTSPDAYGKFSYHWTSNGTTNDKQLKPWLAPNSSATSCDYLDPNNVGLVCNFSGTPTTGNSRK